VVAARHTSWFLDLAEEAATYRTARRWLRVLAADYDNLRAVLDRAVAAPDPDTALRLAGALSWFWWTNHTVEGGRRVAAVLALADGQPPSPQLARAVQAAAMLGMSLTPTEATANAARRSQELFERFGDHRGAAFSKLVLAFIELQRAGPSAAALRLVEEADATFGELDDPWARPSPATPGWRSSPTTKGCPMGPRRSGGGSWNGSRPSTISGGWPSRSSASPSSPRPAATSARPGPPTSGRWPPPATGGRCG
jgi:hypothetical protein